MRINHQQVARPALTATEWRFFRQGLARLALNAAADLEQEAGLSRVGNWKDDPDLEEMLKEIYRRARLSHGQRTSHE